MKSTQKNSLQRVFMYVSIYEVEIMQYALSFNL